MLHTEVMLDALDQTFAITANIHRHMAVALLDLLDRPEERGFKTRWFVMTTLLLRWHNRPFDTLAQVNDGVERVPDDADLLLLAGTVHEDLARADFPQTAAPVDRADHLNEAERALRRALTINPASEEARLHLGRVIHQQGHREEAAGQLTPIVEQSGNRVLRYLAHLFLGAIREEESRSSEAERLYRAAIALDPQEQAADIALSALLDRLGRRRESQERLLEMLKKGPRPTMDPWWTYLFGPPADHLLVRLLSLREEVMK
jgi:tetratricopeptide (TPR) repeat protein